MKYPLKTVHITQEWGVSPERYSRFGFKGHNGIDLRLHQGIGTPVYAPHDGVVKERRFDKDGYGNYLKIENEVEGSVIAHLDSFAVNINKKVKEGDLVGYGGNTGWSTGPHLHWGYYRFPRNRQNGYGGTINQVPLLRKDDADMSNQYKGLDLTNKESMKVAVDVWADVRDGKYVSKNEVEKLVKEHEDQLSKEKIKQSASSAMLSKITPVFEALQSLVQREIVLKEDVKPAVDAYCESKNKEEVENAGSNAVVYGGKEVGRLALLAVYATPISMFLLPIVNGLLQESGTQTQLELAHVIPIVTAILKAVDRSLHKYGKLMGNEQLTKSIARF